MIKKTAVNTTKMLLKMQKKKHRADFSMSPFLVLFLMIFVVGDFLTIYQLIEQMFYQAQYISIIITFVIAVILEGIPYLLAQYIERDNKTAMDKIMILCLCLGFSALIVTLFMLRWNTRDILFSKEDTSLVIASLGQQTENMNNTVEISSGANMMTILLGISPLMTSIFAFALSCIQSIKDKRKRLQELMDLQIAERIKGLKIAENETIEELKRDLLSYDKKLLNNALAQIDIYSALLKNIVRQHVAVKLGTADAVSKLLENEGGN